ncbi:MAG: RDD family protein [Deltaproteobacteria bacterium]|nr:RDD family protein [Deltaproteobacteria bacterium]
MDHNVMDKPKALAGFWRRFLAGIVDVLLAGALSAGCFAWWAATVDLRLPSLEVGWIEWLVQMPFMGDPMMLPGLFLSALVGLSLLYFATVYWHASPGQMALGMMVVGPTGEPVGWARAAVRSVLLGGGVAYLGLGVLWIGFDRLKQGWHDKLAGTYVVRSRRRT